MTSFLAAYGHALLFVFLGKWTLPFMLPLLLAVVCAWASSTGEDADPGRCEHVVVPVEASSRGARRA
jgi:hypothetical protein